MATREHLKAIAEEPVDVARDVLASLRDELTQAEHELKEAVTTRKQYEEAVEQVNAVGLRAEGAVLRLRALIEKLDP